MTYQAATHQIAFVLPLYFWKAEIIFTRISGKNERIMVPIEQSAKPRQVVSTEKLGKGYWQVQLNWSDGNSRYCREQMIEIT